VSEFVDRWVTDVATQRVRPATLDAYQRRLEHHIVPFIGKMKLSALRPDHLQKLYADLVRDGYAPGTVLISHSVLHQALDQAVAWNLISRNPAGLVHPPRSRTTKRDLIALSDLQRVIDYGQNSWLGPLVTLAATTGLRRGELIGLRWNDIHLDEAYLEVKQAVVHIIHKETVLADPKSKSSIRRVTLPAMTVEALRRWQSVGATSPFVFPNNRGHLLHPNTVNSVWGRALKALNIPHVVFHSLRHLSATLLMEAGVSAKVVQERLGHSSISITLGIYSHVTPRLERAAADILDQALK
jgi:integrase